jgi:hypothetical protein
MYKSGKFIPIVLKNEILCLNEYFSYIVEVSFIGGGNQSTRRKPSTYHKVS